MTAMLVFSTVVLCICSVLFVPSLRYVRRRRRHLEFMAAVVRARPNIDAYVRAIRLACRASEEFSRSLEMLNRALRGVTDGQ